MQRTLLLALISILFSSCFILEEYENTAIEESKPREKSRQDILQDSVIAYLSRQYTDENNQTYLPYTFGSVYANKPQEIVELEQLYELKTSLPGMYEHFGEKHDSVIAANDTAIVHKKKEIREKRLYTTYDLTHLYCIKDKKDKTYQVVETRVVAYPNNTVKDMELVFTTDLSEGEFELFEHYIHQDPLVFDSDYSYQSQMNANAYKRLNQAMMDEPTETKGDLLKVILKKVKFYQQHNGFDPEVFTNQLLSDWTKKPTLDVNVEKVIKTSKLIPVKQTIKSKDTGIPYEYLVGYKKFMLISGKWGQDFHEEKAVYCEFDKNHVLKGVLLVDGEHEKYFE